MKRLLLLATLLISTNAYASILDLPSYQSGNDVTIANLELTNTRIENWANGDVEGGSINIAPGSINSQDLAQAVSPVVRWGEAFNSFTYEGMLPATSANLTSDISAGISYVDGYRVQNAATSHTYGAALDTYVYVASGGYYVYCEEPNGSTTCGVPPTDALLLARVITSGSAITAVNDLRTLSIQITTTTTNFPADYRDQAYVSWDTTTALHVEPGSLAIGTTIYTSTTDSASKEIATAINWVEGAKPFSQGKLYLYAYNNAGSTFDFKYSSIDPVYSDVDGNSGGVKRYYIDGAVEYRAIGWAYMSADAIANTRVGNFADVNVPNVVRLDLNSLKLLGTTALPVDNSTPLITEGAEVFRLGIVPSSPTSIIRMTTGLQIAPAGNEKVGVAIFDNGNVFRKANAGPATAQTQIFTIVNESRAGSIGYLEFKVRAGATSGANVYVNGDESGVQIFNGGSNSYIELEELPA